MKEYRLSRQNAIAARSSTGWLLKWRLGNLWIKTPGYIICWTGESYAEIIASQVCMDLGIKNYLEYRPCIIITEDEDTNREVRLLGCESNNFTRGDEIFVSSQRLLKLAHSQALEKIGYIDPHEAFEMYIRDIQEATGLNVRYHTEDMLVLDFLICNFDRNLWNLGILADPNGGYRQAPIFDNGNSFGLDKFEEGEFFRESLVGKQARPFSDSFTKQLELVRPSRTYSSNLSGTKELIKSLYSMCSGNELGIENKLSPGNIEYIETMLQKNMNYLKQHNICN